MPRQLLEEMGTGRSNANTRGAPHRQPQQPASTPQQRPRQGYDARAASHIQKLYRRSRPRAFREITATESPFYQIAAESLHTHFTAAIPDLGDNVRPDLVIINERAKSATVIDIATPFENRTVAFDAARLEKRTKYSHVTDHYQQQGYYVFTDAFIVGALGGWDPANERVIAHLGIGRHYSQLMRRLMCSDAIRWSRDIYIEHITGRRQYEDGQHPPG
ncbi:hypothetical protein HUJ05_010933 [Dendroctonus ponderosae]|nr:hypothetical protein HUJ05_010933 [Dendroctonus ponderosae]